MLALLASVFSFAAPFLPELLKYLNRKQDNAHEIAMFQLQVQAQKELGQLRMEEANVAADVRLQELVHQPQQSFGVQLLDAAKATGLPGWLIAPVFWLFAVLDFINGIMRPYIAGSIVTFYIVVKWAMFRGALTYSNTPEQAVLSVWTTDDLAVLMSCISYYVGGQTRKAVFGGSSLNDKKS